MAVSLVDLNLRAAAAIALSTLTREYTQIKANTEGGKQRTQIGDTQGEIENTKTWVF